MPVRAIAFLGVLAASMLIGSVLFSNNDALAGAAAPRRPRPPGKGEARVDVDARLYQRFGLALGLPKGWRARVRPRPS